MNKLRKLKLNMPANTLDKKYLDLVQDILDNGIKKSSRAGDTISVFGRTIRHDMKDGFPILTTKKMYFKGVITELLWFLQGRTDLRYLLENDCNIWVGDAFRNYEKNAVVGDVIDSHYEPATNKWHLYIKEEFIHCIKKDQRFAKKWGDLGPIYGHNWRNWNGKSDDELYNDYLNIIDKK